MSAAAAPDPVTAFDDHRGLLFTVAYEILGSVADAEDVVQESWLRWADVDHGTVRDPRAYLARIATRQALNRLRTVRRQREEYVGPWLPEPLVTSPDVLEDVELADSVSFAMLVVLETLSPLERAVFVLREVFGFSYDEVATSTDRSPAAVRQLAHRAREHVAARRPREAATSSAADAAAVTERFFEAASGGDLQAMLDLMAPDVVLLSDGGGKKRAALRPIVGADKVVRFLAGVRPEGAELAAERVTVNGGPALLVTIDGVLDSVVAGRVVGGRLDELYLVRNPDKLTDLAPRPATRGSGSW